MALDRIEPGGSGRPNRVWQGKLGPQEAKVC